MIKLQNTVSTTTQSDPEKETHYAYNNSYGIETTKYKDEALAYGGPVVECTVNVSSMFAGTHEEWAAYINECIIDTIKDSEIKIFENDCGMIFISKHN